MSNALEIGNFIEVSVNNEAASPLQSEFLSSISLSGLRKQGNDQAGFRKMACSGEALSELTLEEDKAGEDPKSSEDAEAGEDDEAAEDAGSEESAEDSQEPESEQGQEVYRCGPFSS